MNNLIYTPSVQRHADNLMKSYKTQFPSSTRAQIVHACIWAAQLSERMEAEQNGYDLDSLRSYTSEYWQVMIQYLNAQL